MGVIVEVYHLGITNHGEDTRGELIGQLLARLRSSLARLAAEGRRRRTCGGAQGGIAGRHGQPIVERGRRRDNRRGPALLRGRPIHAVYGFLAVPVEMVELAAMLLGVQAQSFGSPEPREVVVYPPDLDLLERRRTQAFGVFAVARGVVHRGHLGDIPLEQLLIVGADETDGRLSADVTALVGPGRQDVIEMDQHGRHGHGLGWAMLLLFWLVWLICRFRL